jgi:quinol monooxygenase YgiN
MLLVVARLTAHPGQASQLLDALEAYIAIVMANEPGTLYFEIHKPADADPQRFTLLEGYADEAAYALHQAAPYKPAHIARIRSHIAEASAEQFQRQGPLPAPKESPAGR